MDSQKCSQHVTLHLAGGQAVGVKVQAANPKKSSTIIKAHKGVVSNASVWDTQSLLPNQDITPKQKSWSSEARKTPQTGSFMHLHLGQTLVFFFIFFFTLALSIPDIMSKQKAWSSEAKQTPQTGSFMHLQPGDILIFFFFRCMLGSAHSYVCCSVRRSERVHMSLCR